MSEEQDQMAQIRSVEEPIFPLMRGEFKEQLGGKKSISDAVSHVYEIKMQFNQPNTVMWQSRKMHKTSDALRMFFLNSNSTLNHYVGLFTMLASAGFDRLTVELEINGRVIGMSKIENGASLTDSEKDGIRSLIVQAANQVYGDTAH